MIDGKKDSQSNKTRQYNKTEQAHNRPGNVSVKHVVALTQKNNDHPKSYGYGPIFF